MSGAPTLTPIQMLPSEVLSYIFQFVRDAQPDYLDKDFRPFPLAYPETLTYVCSYWRRLAIDSRTLWSHIQISDCRCTYSNHTRILARAKVFAARADPSPVDIHIIRGSHSCSAGDGLDEFSTSVAMRTRSFDLSAESSVKYRISLFQSWLKNCKPGSLNELVLKRNTRGSTFERIEVSETSASSKNILLRMSHGFVEDRLLPVKVLRLTGIYFHWESQVYHGLVELRLLPVRDGTNIDITQAQLKAILAASPRLRELHFGLQITDVLLPNSSSMTVTLNDLEVVNLCSMKRGEDYGPLLQLLAPGTKPMQLSMKYCLATSAPLPGGEAIGFFTRSNVTKLHIDSFEPENNGQRQPLVLLELLRCIPTLQALSLRCLYLGPNPSGDGQPQDHESSAQVNGTELKLPLSPQLDVVHLRDCTIDLDYLRNAIRAVPVQKLKYRGCRFHSMEDGYSSELEDSKPQNSLPPTFSYVPSSWPLNETDLWA